MAARARTAWRCQNCGASAPRWVGRCGECGEFGTFVEEVDEPSAPLKAARVSGSGVRLSDAGSAPVARVSTGLNELDDVLGGGLVPGSLVLLGGEPGIGKSTLLLQAAEGMAAAGGSVLYVCGEESPDQIGLRARRLGTASERITLLPEIDLGVIEATALAAMPSVIVVDSIQTVFDSELSGAPGSVGQVRACTTRLMRLAKEHGITVLIVGHVTKDGAIAGPRVLEHMVDTVLYFEGDRDHLFRIVRAVKNRFGASSEIGVFEMSESGLVPVTSPSASLLSEREGSVAGSAVFAALEGSRPLLVEVQALVTPSFLPTPRRLSTGIDVSRLHQVIAVLERHARVSLSGSDVVVAVSGGIKVNEPAVDLPLALAIGSAAAGVPLPPDTVSFGEIGLTGHVRSVPHASVRAKESSRFGFERVRCSSRNDASALGPGVVFDGVDRLSDIFPLTTS